MKEGDKVCMKSVIRLVLIYMSIFILVGCSEKKWDPISMDTDLLLSINRKSASISFVDLNEKKLIAEWVMENPYSGGLILPNGDTLLLYGNQLETVDVYSLSTGKLETKWNVGNGIVNAYLLKNKKEVVFADQNKNEVRFFNVKGKEIKSVSTEKKPFTILELEEKLLVLNMEDEKLSVIDIKSKKKLDTIPIHPFAAGALIREKSGEVWIGGHGVGNKAESDIHVYNVQSRELEKTIHAPMMPINFEEMADHIYVLSHGSNTLYKLTEDGETVQSIQVGANPFALLSFHEELIVAGYDSNDIYFIDPVTLKIMQKVDVGKGPFQLIVRESE